MNLTICCPYCGTVDSGVVDSRQTDGSKRRRRRCKNNHTFVTYEATIEQLDEIEKRMNSYNEIMLKISNLFIDEGIIKIKDLRNESP